VISITRKSYKNRELEEGSWQAMSWKVCGWIQE